MVSVLLCATPDLRQNPAPADRARALASELRANTSDLLRHLIVRSVVTSRTITLALESSKLCKALGISKTDLSPDLLKITAPFHLRRRGVEAKLAIGVRPPEPDPILLRTLADAHRWAADLQSGDRIKTVALKAGHQTVGAVRQIRTRLW